MSKEIDPKLLEILVCPLTKETLSWDKENNELISKKAGLAYPVKDGIPIMLPDEARKILTMEARIKPTTPTIKNPPSAVRSRLVVYPYIDRAANAPAVMKKALATLAPVKANRMVERDRPMTVA